MKTEHVVLLAAVATLLFLMYKKQATYKKEACCGMKPAY